jgi:hypothetical protein
MMKGGSCVFWSRVFLRYFFTQLPGFYFSFFLKKSATSKRCFIFPPGKTRLPAFERHPTFAQSVAAVAPMERKKPTAFLPLVVERRFLPP